jgi:hypothetical protein
MPRELRLVAWAGIVAGAGCSLAFAHEVQITQAAGVDATWLRDGLHACLLVMLVGVVLATVDRGGVRG